MQPARPYTPDQLAERWECSAETIRQMVKRGELPGFRVGRMIRIPRHAVEEIESCQTSPSADCGAASAPQRASQTASVPGLPHESGFTQVQ